MITVQAASSTSHAEVVANGGSGQCYGQEGELDQKLGGGQGQQRLNTLRRATQLAKGGNNVKSVQDYGQYAQVLPSLERYSNLPSLGRLAGDVKLGVCLKLGRRGPIAYGE